MNAPSQIVGDDPPVDGMAISVRLRRDFTVTDAGRLLNAARRMYRDLYPGTSAEDTAAMVACAADALFVILEQAGLLGDVIDDRVAEHETDGLVVVGWRAEITLNEPNPLPPGPNCLRAEDVFALPTPGAADRP